MILTLTIEQQGHVTFDIQVPSKQKIRETIQVLEESNLIRGENLSASYRIYSVRNGVLLNTDCSYEENRVFTADIIRIMEE